ncbi:hypothetical protein MUK42_00286 [Musa troglodytarum]|uniref:Uncharacterized protein n=1 Tax=Musa troglodytarum TaxID=320322 RepID=A0A9E7JJ57_9LILI|nr:hypothetical protein MUK42_00286 [Musa troglodytarum]
MKCTLTRAQPEISTGFTSSLATVTVRMPFSMDAFAWSTLAFSSSWNLPLLRSTRYHLSFLFSSSSLLRSLLIRRTLPSPSSSIPGKSATMMGARGASFRSTRVLAKNKGSQMSRER